MIYTLLVAPLANADCDFATGITPGPNKTFVYTEACHQKVGAVVQDNKNKTTQVDDLNKAISLKNVALDNADKRATLWMDTSGKLEDRLQKVDNLQKTNERIYFGLGVLTAVISIFAAAKAIQK
jgi:hypothetical protein